MSPPMVSARLATLSLIGVLQKVRPMLVRPGNDFPASDRWATEAEALAEWDEWLSQLIVGAPIVPLELSILFAPTGPLQELSMASGWHEKYRQLAAEFDSAIEVYLRAGGVLSSPAEYLYVLDYFGQFMTDDEKHARMHLLRLAKSAHMERPMRDLHERQMLGTTKAALALLADGAAVFYERAARRILAEHGDQVFLNRCPKCRTLCRTPAACLCPNPECNHTWYEIRRAGEDHDL